MGQTEYFSINTDSTITLPKFGSDPVGTEQGRMYYNTANGAPRVYTSNGWSTFGAAVGTAANPISSIAEAQINNVSEGLWYFKNGNNTVQELYYDPTDGGWILVASNYAGDTLIPGATGRYSLTYTLDRDNSPTPLGTPSPNSDYIIGNWYMPFAFTRCRMIGFGRNSTSTSYTWTNRGGWIDAQFPVTNRDQVIDADVTPVTWNAYNGAGGRFSASRYFSIDGIWSDYRNGGFSANANQTTVGAIAAAGASGDPTTGCYMGHGSSEGSFEGWYDLNGNAMDATGYTTWLR